MNTAVFLDRDGTLNKLAPQGECVRSPGQVELLRGAAHAVGMLRRAAGELGIDLGESWMIGDAATDIDAGAAAGCRTLRVQPVDFSLLDAAHAIIAGNAQPGWTAAPSCTSVLSPVKKIISIVP
ncbi:MAG TPA: HAD hydrolase-like protein [Thermoleophilaceae bacterium]